MARRALGDYLCPDAGRPGQKSQHQRAPMADDDKKSGRLKTRIFLLLFFGLALLISIMTILGTWEGQREGVLTPPEPNAPAATLPPAAR